MRSSTKTFVSLAGLGIVIAAARAGMPVPIALATEAPAEPTQATDTSGQTTPRPQESAPKTQPKASAATVQTGAAIKYRFGTIQVKVTKSGGKISKVSCVKSSYTRVPQGTMTYLLQASVQANGSKFANVTRATYTVDAFKKSLDSALGKF